MPITQFLNGHRFDPETRRILGVAFEQVCAALRTGDCDDDVKQAIANKIIELAKTGERNPDLLCEHALEDIRGHGLADWHKWRSPEPLPALIQASVAERLLAL